MKIESDTLAGYGGWPVFYRYAVPDGAVGRVLLVHGYSEHSGRYGEVIEALGAAGLAVVAPDHRGHGRTARVHGDLEHREWILADLVAAHRRLLELGSGPVFVVAHSLGAVLALRCLQRAPGAFAGAVLNGTALRIPASIPWTVRTAARIIGRIAPTTPMQPFFDPVRNMRDPERQRALREDPLVYKGRIRARTGVEVMRLVEEVRAGLPEVVTPLLLTHGASDRHVPAEVSEQICAAVASEDKSVVCFPGLLHETWQEPERREVIGTWVSWIAARVGTGSPSVG